MDENNIVRFYSCFFKKALCTVCHCIVLRHLIGAHAQYHVKKDEGQFQSEGTYRGFNDVTVCSNHTIETGWRTISSGPR